MSSKLEISSSAIGPLIQGDNNTIYLRDNHVNNQQDNALDPELQTSLHDAAVNCDADLVKRLIEERGEDVNQTDDYNKTPLEALLFTTNIPWGWKDSLTRTLVALLEHGATINMKTLTVENNCMLLYRIVKARKVQLLEYLLQQGLYINARDTTVLRTAASHGDIEGLKMLVAHGADVNILGSLQEPAVFKFNEYVIFSNRNMDKQQVTETLQLLNCKAHVRVMNLFGYSLLGKAAMGFHADQVALLIETFGAEVNQTNDEGETALHHVFSCLHDNSNKEDVIKTVETLKHFGANLNAKNTSKLTSLKIVQRAESSSFDYLIPYLTPTNTDIDTPCCNCM